MLKRIVPIAILLFITPASVFAVDAPSPDPNGDAALAEQFSQFAQFSLAQRVINSTLLDEAIAEFKIACKLNPNEPRFWRLLAEAALQNHDPETALTALQSYAQLARDDQGVQTQIIDLFTAKMQSADERLSYLKGLVEDGRINEAVRSYAATRAANLLYDRGQVGDAETMLAQALRLNPVNVEALRMNYDRVSDTGTPYERAAALLAMLRGNPAQPDAMARLAGELAAAGLIGDSISWYNSAIDAAARTQRQLEPVVLVDAAAEMIIGDQFRQADAKIGLILQMDRNNVDGWYLAFLQARRGGDKETATKIADLATTALLERIYDAHRAFAGANPATQPSGDLAVRLPDLADDVKKLKEKKDEDLIKQYAAALTDLAWMEIYFAEQPAAAKPMIDALRTLLPPDNITVPRLEGWSALLTNKPDDAKVKLSAVAERDPLSMMGLIRLTAKTNPEKRDEYQLQARKLVNENASGLLGAMLQDGLRDLGGKLIPTKDADAIREGLNAFPKDWLTILEKPQGFYSIRAEAEKVSHGFAEPMFAKITLLNISDYDLTIGADGVIHPDLWFDVNLKGLANQTQSGVVFDRMTKALVLHKGQSITQPVRLDAGKLAVILATNPLMDVQLYFSVITNPTSAANGAVVPGAGGYRQMLKRVVDRISTPFQQPQQKQKIFNTLATGAPMERMRMITLLRSYVIILSGEKADRNMKAQAQEFLQELRSMTQDSAPAIRGWAQCISFMLLPEDQRLAAAKSLIASDHWPTRALALLVMDGLPAEEGKKLAAQMQQDQEPLIQELATAVADDLAHPTTQPTTGPTTEPTTQPLTP